LYFTDDYGQTWDLKNSFTCPILPIEGITGGRQDGEIYLLVVYRQFMGFVRHVYIHHSLDYGETFTVYHPVSIGNDPVYANFEAGDTLGKPPFEVQFTDLSSGGLGYWEWDFNNDGITDSYQQNPIFIYNDTGYFSVELKGSYSVITDSAIRYNYIHVTNLTNVSEAEQQGNVNLACFPNPFNENVTITLTSTVDDDPGYITIFDVSGLFVNEIKLEKTSNKYEYITNWDGRSYDGNKVSQGVYFIILKDKNCSKKILFIN
jgi:PKD repeat protein